MSIPFSVVVKDPVAQSFRALGNILEKAKAHAAETGAEESAFLENRLYPDMYPMKWQVQFVTNLAVKSAARLMGVANDDLPDLPKVEVKLDELIARVHTAAQMVMEADDAVLDAAPTRAVTLVLSSGQSMDLDGKTYVLGFFLPNLHFHCATAYGLLRSQGVAIGKRDFLGA